MAGTYEPASWKKTALQLYPAHQGLTNAAERITSETRIYLLAGQLIKRNIDIVMQILHSDMQHSVRRNNWED
jgi:hypothetical protein